MREPHVRFDERDLETEQLPLLPRQISTLPHLADELWIWDESGMLYLLPRVDRRFLLRLIQCRE